MEIFIFPELLYSLVLANIMSPRLWRWREAPWFEELEKMKPYRRITRMKQYIMDHYVFNLDLDTWGLTTKEKEIARFCDFIDRDTLSQSNALFGYEGDKYYFDIDIRTHFGLNKYSDDTVPYWKTETVEAMDAFRFKPNYPSGAGECVSLAALYAAAFFVVAGIPLKDIYLLATPLHSQNFIDVDDGILTNNRRLVTKNMWFNGTELSAQARRAIENERITVVTHESGYAHTIYDDATIHPEIYRRFSERLQCYLCAGLTVELLDNFLRHSRDIQKCFQLRWPMHGTDHYIGLDRVFAFEESGPYNISDNTRPKLMAEIDQEAFQPTPLLQRIVLNDLEDFLRHEKMNIRNPLDQERLRAKFACDCFNSQKAIEGLIRFCCVKPRLPDAATKKFSTTQEPLHLELDMTREDIIERLEAIRDRNAFANLAFYAYRDLNRTEAEPFVLGAIERSPVSLAGAKDLELDAVAAKILSMPAESIYDETGRLAQPDEVWNYGRGDGAEKALLLANILRDRLPDQEMTIEVSPQTALLKAGSQEYRFASQKGLKPQVWRVP
jgi:hypothetical protein